MNNPSVAGELEELGLIADFPDVDIPVKGPRSELLPVTCSMPPPRPFRVSRCTLILVTASPPLGQPFQRAAGVLRQGLRGRLRRDVFYTRDCQTVGFREVWNTAITMISA
jgi:hypothetical protein